MNKCKCITQEGVVTACINQRRGFVCGSNTLDIADFPGFPTDLAVGESHAFETDSGHSGVIKVSASGYSIDFDMDAILLKGMCLKITPTIPLGDEVNSNGDVACEESEDLPDHCDTTPQTLTWEYNNKRVEPCQN